MWPLTAECKQCGVRFADAVIGKGMEDHPDMPSRQNRKANQDIERVEPDLLV